MTAAENILRATRWQRTTGRPLGSDTCEYRLLFRHGDCFACYIFARPLSMNLPAVQRLIRLRQARAEKVQHQWKKPT